MTDAQTTNTPATAVEREPISCMNWFWTVFAMGIPLVNVAFCLYWIFTKRTQPSKRNFAIATLIWMVLWVIFYGALLSGLNGWLSHLSDDDSASSSHYSQQHDDAPESSSTSTSV
ncbi:hypothetical protein R84981_002070 [Carnimonas sp. R-84981]|uniref:hypothetical protein n=1 Tax=Carnimonas bestiolae TaxID=3402172 RepID=UPI003EDC9D52